MFNTAFAGLDLEFTMQGGLAMQVLMVNNDRQIRNFIKNFAELEGFSCDESHSRDETADKLAATYYDLVVIDCGPDCNGMEILKAVREKSQTSVIIIGPYQADIFKSPFFNKDNDEFLQKPYKSGELLVKMRTVAKRILTEPERMTLKIGVLTIDEIKRTVFVNSTGIETDEPEFKLISFFARNPRQYFSLDDLFNQAWYSHGEKAAIELCIKSLRVKLGKYRNYISNPQGKGFVFDPDKGKIL